MDNQTVSYGATKYSPTDSGMLRTQSPAVPPRQSGVFAAIEVTEDLAESLLSIASQLADKLHPILDTKESPTEGGVNKSEDRARGTIVEERLRDIALKLKISRDALVALRNQIDL